MKNEKGKMKKARGLGILTNCRATFMLSYLFFFLFSFAYRYYGGKRVFCKDGRRGLFFHLCLGVLV
jgi:hypothetical protein